MDPNTYAIAAVFNGQRRKELGLLPPETDFTPFNLSALRQAPRRNERPRAVNRQPAVQDPVHAETLA
ncbi:MAG: hypothetical protein JO069_18785 [Verrucomicrobia bacterium]|nr:hypothetical protein [Verrucomicrobiota bacterium]